MPVIWLIAIAALWALFDCRNDRAAACTSSCTQPLPSQGSALLHPQLTACCVHSESRRCSVPHRQGGAAVCRADGEGVQRLPVWTWTGIVGWLMSHQ